MGRSDLFADVDGQDGIIGLLKRGLVKQHGGEATATARQQRRVFSEPRLFVGRRALATHTAQQAGAGKLGDGRNGGNTRSIEGPARLAQSHPFVAGHIGKQLTANGDTHPVDHDDQHQTLGRQRGHHLFQNPFDRQHLVPLRTSGRPIRQEPRELMRLLLANLCHMLEQS